MTGFKVPRIVCDGCGETIDGMPDESFTHLRRTLKDEGWKVLRISAQQLAAEFHRSDGPARVDLCDGCEA